jgi:hypothetical protein
MSSTTIEAYRLMLTEATDDFTWLANPPGVSQVGALLRQPA